MLCCVQVVTADKCDKITRVAAAITAVRLSEVDPALRLELAAADLSALATVCQGTEMNIGAHKEGAFLAIKLLHWHPSLEAHCRDWLLPEIVRCAKLGELGEDDQFVYMMLAHPEWVQVLIDRGFLAALAGLLREKHDGIGGILPSVFQLVKLILWVPGFVDKAAGNKALAATLPMSAQRLQRDFMKALGGQLPERLEDLEAVTVLEHPSGVTLDNSEITLLRVMAKLGVSGPSGRRRVRQVGGV